MKSFLARFFLMCSAALISAFFIASTTLAATYTVDSPLGGTVGTAKCDAADNEDCTFEDAVALANANPGSTIDFGIDNNFIPNQTYTIVLKSAVDITEAVTIDGFTQDDAQPNSVAAPGLTDAVMRVVIDGSTLPATPFPADDFCIRIDTKAPDDVVSIKGLTINSCPDNGITVRGNNKIIQGNYIGTDDTGTLKVGNTSNGIYVDSAHDVLIGGPNPADRNLISGNNTNGIVLTASVSGSDIEGNFIGLDSTGTADLGNGGFGVLIGNMAGGTHSGNVVGNQNFDVGDGKRNYISGNTSDGIFIENATVTVMFRNDQIRNNYIGTEVTGTISIPNDHGGIGIKGSTGVSIDQNLVSGNGGNGINIFGDTGTSTFTNLTEIILNKIGTDALGVNPLGNSGTGILLHDGVISTKIGDGTSGNANIIAYNSAEGVAISDNAAMHTTQNSILTNSIFGNGTLGIDLGTTVGPDGVTLNDANDADANANEWQNYPMVASAVHSGGNTIITGTFHSVPATLGYTLEFYANDTADPSGYGEGQTFIGSITGVNTDALGDYSFSTAFPGNFYGKYITATATDNFDYTSEFGPMASTDLSIAKTISVPTAREGEDISFSVTVSNISATNATSVEVTDVLWGGLTYLNYTSSQGTYNNTTGIWDIGTLTAGSSATLNVYARLKSCGTFNNTATITRIGEFDTNTANNTASASSAITCTPVAGGSAHSGSSSTQGIESLQAEGLAAPEEVGYCAYTLDAKDPLKITRYEFAKMMLEFNCHVIPTEMPVGEKSFIDFARQTYEDSEKNNMMLVLYYALDAGIISGYPDGTLRPNDPVVYAEAAKIVYNTVDGSLNTYKPVLSLLPIKLTGSEWFINYFIFMIDLVWNSDLDPSAIITAQDAENIVNLIIEKYPK